jgi:hypothetical protein
VFGVLPLSVQLGVLIKFVMKNTTAVSPIANVDPSVTTHGLAQLPTDPPVFPPNGVKAPTREGPPPPDPPANTVVLGSVVVFGNTVVCPQAREHSSGIRMR